ncbi:MAG: undecaprenyl-phosphate glucose phosphotransferase [Lachnospiraceae bacterium]|jgi:Undecaprenyl-phosphate glucose phosphotransferase|nr:undecaprenyl-phosphate glucose phosphotransferase [Lachnospiraceae bacterium]
MIKDNQKLLNRFLIILDALLIILAFSLSYFLKFSKYSPLIQMGFLVPKFGYFFPFEGYAPALWFIVPGYLLIYNACNLYSPRRVSSKRYECWSIIKSNCFAILYFIAVLYFKKISVQYSRWFTLYFFILNIMLSVFFRITLRIILKYFRKNGMNLKHILLVGYSDICERYIDELLANRSWGYHVHGIIDDHKDIGYKYRNIPVIGTTKELTTLLSKYETLDEIAITLGLHDYQNLEYIVNCCEKSGVHTKFLPDYNRIIPTKPYIEDVNGLAVINIRKVPLSNLVNKVTKRIIDIFGATFALLLFSIPMIIVSIIIKVTSPGPLIFCQERVGLHNKKFKMYKFRSMCEQTEAAEKKAWTVKDDPRVTPIGRFIRKTSIDELPQLFNVLKGEMSLIGPRPERPYFVEQFKETIPRYMIKHQVRPGLTGWAQVNGYRGDTSIKRRIDCDLYYIENWTLGLDFKILILTFIKGFINKNAY